MKSFRAIRRLLSWTAAALAGLLLLITAVTAITQLCAGKPCVIAFTIFFLAVGLLAITASAVMPIAIEGALLNFLGQVLMVSMIIAPVAGTFGSALLTH